MKLHRFAPYIFLIITSAVFGFYVGEHKEGLRNYISPRQILSFESKRAPLLFTYPVGVTITRVSNAQVYAQPNYIEQIDIRNATDNGEPSAILGYIVVEKYTSLFGLKPEEKIFEYENVNLPAGTQENKPQISQTMINGQVGYEVKYPVQEGVYNSGADIQYYIFKTGLLYRIGIVAKKTPNQEKMKQIIQTIIFED